MKNIGVITIVSLSFINFGGAFAQIGNGVQPIVEPIVVSPSEATNSTTA